nr:hypothetical protein [Mycoplasmopsis bovis]
MKYELTLDWIIKLAPIKFKTFLNLDRGLAYQQIINDYAECHWKTNNYGFSPSSKRMLARMLSMKGY